MGKNSTINSCNVFKECSLFQHLEINRAVFKSGSTPFARILTCGDDSVRDVFNREWGTLWASGVTTKPKAIEPVRIHRWVVLGEDLVALCGGFGLITVHVERNLPW